MAVTREEVRASARLARLRLSEEEVALYQAQFSRILELMAELSSLDTSATEATSALAGPANVMRADEPAAFPEPERLRALAPEREGDYFQVKKVIA